MTKTPDEGQTLPQPDPATEPLTLEQWAAAKSAVDRRVELLNGFVTTERAAGRFSDTPSGWDARYLAFGARPV